MAKDLDNLPSQFQELARALDGADLGGWSIASAEGGWVTPTREDWGKRSGGEVVVTSPAERRAARLARRTARARRDVA